VQAPQASTSRHAAAVEICRRKYAAVPRRHLVGAPVQRCHRRVVTGLARVQQRKRDYRFQDVLESNSAHEVSRCLALSGLARPARRELIDGFLVAQVALHAESGL